jgi:hypothetical protein
MAVQRLPFSTLALIARNLVLTAAALQLCACGGGSSSSDSAQGVINSANAAAASSNSTSSQAARASASSSSTAISSAASDVPVILGDPAGTAAVGQNYTFRPSASDSGGARLTFSIENGPVWTHFDTNTGELWGTPTSGDIGNYPDIRISVSNGSAHAALNPFSIIVARVVSGTATVSWIPPTKNSDGSPLVDLAGFEIFYGKSKSTLTQTIRINNPGTNRYIVQSLSAGTWYFAVTAVNSKGVNSNMSDETSKTI